jgi:Scavenger receptor cysteine-rich domain
MFIVQATGDNEMLNFIKCFKRVLIKIISDLIPDTSLMIENFQANVVCRQLGFPYGAIGAPCCSPFGQVPNYPNQFSFSYSDVGCSGTEPGLNSCPHLSNSIICWINEAAGVICNTTSEIKHL